MWVERERAASARLSLLPGIESLGLSLALNKAHKHKHTGKPNHYKSHCAQGGQGRRGNSAQIELSAPKNNSVTYDLPEIVLQPEVSKTTQTCKTFAS